MVNSRANQLDETFFALSDPTRRAMLSRLSQGDLSVAELAEPFEMSPPAVSKHLRVLERAGLLEQSREGRARICHLTPEPLHAASQWVQQYRHFCDDKLDRLESFLDTLNTDQQSKDHKLSTPKKKR